MAVKLSVALGDVIVIVVTNLAIIKIAGEYFLAERHLNNDYVGRAGRVGSGQFNLIQY